MKKWILCIALIAQCAFGNAQTFKEWFRQKKTKIEYLVTQIAALQVYIEVAQKGYKIVDQGLTTISRIKQGDFNLHADFLNALKLVSPKIRTYAPVAQVIQLQLQLAQVCKTAIKKARENDYLSSDEVDYLSRVYTKVLNNSADNIDELTTLLTDAAYTVSDDERIGRIDLLYRDMQEEYQFVQRFSDQLDVLLASRKKDVQESTILGTLTKEKK